MMQAEQMKVTDYFGFDLGDGESAVAWVRAGAMNEPQLIELAGKKSLLTALGQHPEMGTLIGEQALLADPDQLYLRFKSRFLFDGRQAEPLIRRFAAAVLDELMRSGKLTDPERAAFFIGCPSGWDDSAREGYRLLFEQAGFRNVTIVSESRAAFMFVRESYELNLQDSALSAPTLIIDAGSSTTDFTFIHQLRTVRAFDFGETCLGGGLIDRMLLDRNVARSPIGLKLSSIFESCPQYGARSELEARKVKEMYFTRRAQGHAARFQVPCESSVKIYCERPPLTLDLSCDDEDMDAILNMSIEQLGGQSYLSAYRQGLMSAKQQLKETPPELILLTGGASRMDFVESVAREVFPSAQVLHGAEPEFSIARGLCYALRVDQKTEKFLGDVRLLIESDEVEQILLRALPKLFYAIAPVIADGMIEDSAMGAFKRWRQGDLKTLDDMSEAIRAALVQSLQDGAIREGFAPIIARWIEGIRPELEALTDPICTRYDLPLTSLRLPSTLDVDRMGLELSPGDLMNFGVLQTLVDVAVGSIVAAILGGSGMAVLMAGPIGLVLSFVIGFVASRLGTSYAKRHLGKWDMPMLMRQAFTVGPFRRKLQGKREQLETQFADQLIGLIDPPGEQVRQLVDSVSGAIETQLGQMAERARLLIH